MKEGGARKEEREVLGTEAKMLGAAGVVSGDRSVCNCPRSEASEHFGALSPGHWRLPSNLLQCSVFLCFLF